MKIYDMIVLLVHTIQNESSFILQFLSFAFFHLYFSPVTYRWCDISCTLKHLLYKHSSCKNHHISAPCPHRIYDCTRNLAPGSHHWVAHFHRSNNQNAELRHRWNLARHNIQCIWKHREHLCISLNIHLHVLVNHYMVGVRTLSNFFPSIFGCGKSLGNVPMPQLSSSL